MNGRKLDAAACPSYVDPGGKREVKHDLKFREITDVVQGNHHTLSGCEGDAIYHRFTMTASARAEWNCLCHVSLSWGRAPKEGRTTENLLRGFQHPPLCLNGRLGLGRNRDRLFDPRFPENVGAINPLVRTVDEAVLDRF